MIAIKIDFSLLAGYKTDSITTVCSHCPPVRTVVNVNKKTMETYGIQDERLSVCPALLACNSSDRDI